MNDLFVENYGEARELFVEAADKAGFRHMRFRVPHEDSPELFQDYALLRRDPKKLLIHISGLHGIEGYMGSPIQRALLRETFPEEGPSLLFIHAFNPYGMAFYRRANGYNVDLNRNYRTGPARPNPDYALFDSYLNPRSRWEFKTGAWKGFYHYKRIGLSRSTMAVAMGQASHPKGIFYMGDRVQRELVLCQEFLKAHAREAEEVVIIDAHSGLGDYLGELLFVDVDGGPEDPAYFESAFGRQVSYSDPSKGIYKNQGPLWDGMRAFLPGAQVHYVLQEFGARDAFQTLHALREENFEWHQRPAGAERPERVRSLMLDAFCPHDEAWRKNVVEKGVLRWKQALEKLASSV